MELLISILVAFFIPFLILMYIDKKYKMLFAILPVCFILSGLLFIFTYMGLTQLEDNKKNNSINNPNEYVIYDDTSSVKEFRVDFNKNRFFYVNRNDTFKVNKKYYKEVKKPLETIIEDVISDNDNLSDLTEKEKEEFERKNIRFFYRIRTYDNKIYYVKDINYTRELENMLYDNMKIINR